MNAALLKSDKQGWLTPPEILDLVRKVGPIALDPATSEDNPTRAFDYITGRFFDDDGLKIGWHGLHLKPGLTYCNPPYGRALKDWAAKFAEEGRKGCELITLTPARPDTKWFKHLLTADMLCFWRGRIRFVGAPAPAPFPSVIAYWGKNVGRFCEVFSPHANWMVEP